MDSLYRDNIYKSFLDFDYTFFLKEVYNITSYNDLLKWIEIKTKLVYYNKNIFRVITSTMNAYWNEFNFMEPLILKILKDNFIENFDGIFNLLLPDLETRIVVTNNSILLKNVPKQTYNKDELLILNNYILNTFITDIKVRKFLVIFSSKPKIYYKMVISENLLYNEFVNYIVRKIDKTIEKYKNNKDKK